jgi:hypothetical protein
MLLKNCGHLKSFLEISLTGGVQEMTVLQVATSEVLCRVKIGLEVAPSEELPGGGKSRCRCRCNA